MATEQWPPGAACTLPTVERPLRLAEWDALLATSRLVERPEPGLLRIGLDGGADRADDVRDLTARESACCAFFGFDVRLDGADGIVLDVRVPPGMTPILDGLAARAGASR